MVEAPAQVIYQLRYTGGPRVQVEMVLPRGADVFVMPRAVPMGYGEQPYDRFVENLRGWAPSGVAVKVERQEGPRWKLTPGAERIRYEVDVERMEREILAASDASKIRPRYVGLLGYSVFGCAEGRETDTVRLVVHAPQDWPVLSTLNPAGGELNAANFYALADSQVLMGPEFKVRRVDSKPPLFVALYAEGDADLDRIARLAGEAYQRVIAYFGSAPFPHYTVHMELLAPVSDRHQYGFSMEHLNSSTYYLARGEAVADDARTRYNFAHHITHAWIPKRCYGEGYFPFTWELAPLLDSIWFSEGFGQYAALEALVEAMPPEEGKRYREQVLQARFRRNLDEAPPFLKRMTLVDLSRVASTRYAEDFRTGRLVFSRGALMAAEMDDRIRAESKGAVSLREALRALVAWSAANKRLPHRRAAGHLQAVHRRGCARNTRAVAAAVGVESPATVRGVHMSLQGKSALITGGSRGIGRGIALKLAEQGVKVAIHYYQNEAAAKDTLAKVKKLGSDGFLVQGDVCRPGDIAKIFQKVQAEFRKLDIFVANARPEVPHFFQPPMEIPLENWDTAMDSQAKAFLVAVREAARLMPDGGRIMAITYATGSRTGGVQPWAGMGSAKAALESLVRYFAVALAKRGITVNALSPGWTEDSVLNTLPTQAQELIRNWHVRGWTPMGRLGTPEDVGNVVSLFCQAEAGWITGQTIYADGGASLMNPEVPPEIQLG